MNVETHTKTHSTTTYSVEKVLKIQPPEEIRGRGLLYYPDMDEAALNEARSFHEAATTAIRTKTKIADLPVHLKLDRDNRGVVASAYASFHSSKG